MQQQLSEEEKKRLELLKNNNNIEQTYKKGMSGLTVTLIFFGILIGLIGLAGLALFIADKYKTKKILSKSLNSDSNLKLKPSETSFRAVRILNADL